MFILKKIYNCRKILVYKGGWNIVNYRYETSRQRGSAGTGGVGLSGLCPKLVAGGGGGGSQSGGIGLGVGHLATQESGGTCAGIVVATTVAPTASATTVNSTSGQRIQQHNNHTHGHRRQRKLSIISQPSSCAHATIDRKVRRIFHSSNIFHIYFLLRDTTINNFPRDSLRHP